MALTPAEKQRLFRLRIKMNKDKDELVKQKARERYHKQKRLISDMLAGEKTQIRQKWRSYKKRQRNSYRALKIYEENSTSSINSENDKIFRAWEEIIAEDTTEKEIMAEEDYNGYEADPLDENYQVKCGQILVSASQKFSIRCSACKEEFNKLKHFVTHCVNRHSFTDFEADAKITLAPSRNLYPEEKEEELIRKSPDDEAQDNLITMGPPACGTLDESNSSFNQPQTEKNENKNNKNISLDKNEIELKPLIKPENSEDDESLRSPRKRIYEQSECRFQCKYCDKSYPYSSSLSKHRKTFHNDIKKYQCSFCETRFTEEVFLVRHQRKNHKTELEPYAEAPILIIEDVDDSIIKNEPVDIDDSIECPEINEDEPNKNYVNSNHNQTHLSPKKIKFDSSSNNNQSLESSSWSIEQRPPKVLYKCSMCSDEDDAIFRTKRDLLTHENHIHLHKEKFRCNNCNIGFPSKKLFQDHEQVAHQDQRPFKCSICFFAFKERKHLLRHERVHTGEKPFKCSFCVEQFTRKDALKTHHLKEHTNVPFE